MQRFKILAVVALLIFSFFMLTALSNSEPQIAAHSEDYSSNVDSKKSAIDIAWEREFHLKKQKLRTAVQAYFKKAIAAGDIVGAGVSIVQGDSIILFEGFGKRSIDAKKKVDGETIFRLGSLSKGFTGVLAADLKNEGKLNWDDKVSDYIPEFHLGDQNNTDKITLAIILSHTSGTPYHSFTNLVDAGVSLDKIAKKFTEVKPISEPGTMYSYQNAMFALSATIMKKATGDGIAELFQNRFFKPLGMHTATTDYETLLQSDNISMPHVRSRRGWKSTKLTDSYHNAIAAGGINASALDMAKWMRFLLGHNPEVMDKTALAEAFEPRVDINIGRKYYKKWPGHLSSHYGFGWRIHRFEDLTTKAEETVWHHGGSVNHFRNEIAVFPDDDLGICVLMNSNSPLAKTVIPDLREIVASIYDDKQNLSKTSAETATVTFE
ncbi:serine hydrolase domain-containing protein [Maribacter halichondriae]|uniref:serine hydrolase domain-containing protein n=1 Tax=Maribacter halichondriae TaxID=2980554 RepID=UPI002358FA4F|nr:serine hydrolase domain-containing protein [Maribacter sp. Hal144]